MIEFDLRVASTARCECYLVAIDFYLFFDFFLFDFFGGRGLRVCVRV